MPRDSKTRRALVSAPQFLAALERSGALTDAEWREVHKRFVQGTVIDDSKALAKLLVKEGTLTEFQARRLLRGKKSLALGRYALLERIGAGARGRVFKGRHRLMDRVVALKVFVPNEALSKTSVSRFYREMKIVALLDHPNVVRAIDAAVHKGCPYIVTEYLEGNDLEHVYARRGPLPPDDVIDYMAQAARGLAHAHAKGVIHRDIKPRNVFLTDTGTVKVLDLGFGQLAGMAGQPGNIFDTDEGITVGTTDYMSPEQITNQAIDTRTDLFSLGCMMYRLLTGAYAFPGATAEHRLVRRMREGHVPITDVRSGLPYRLVAIVDHLLALCPADRFSSAAEVVEALEALIPPAHRPEGGTSAKSGAKRSGARDRSAPVEPEAPLDWSVIEAALRPTDHGERKVQRLVDRNEPPPPLNWNLSSESWDLENEGIESGGEVDQKYRDNEIQIKEKPPKVRSTTPRRDAVDDGLTWLEKIGEMLGDALAEPSAAQLLVVVLAVFVGLMLALGFALG